jgi:hypothetical protein
MNNPCPADGPSRGGVGWAVLAVLAAGSFHAAGAPAPTLQYLEPQEQVRISFGQEVVLYQYQPDRNGFVSARGDWVGWDGQAGNWLSVPRSGSQLRFNAEGAFLGQESPPTARKAPAAGGYNPALDVGDSGKKAAFDAQAAWDYLGQRDKAYEEGMLPVAGEDGGAPVEPQYVGGAGAIKEKQMREEWAARPGVHQNDPNAAMETGEVEDPLKKLADTIGNISATVAGVADTIKGVDQIQDQIKNFGDDDLDDDAVDAASQLSGAAAGPAGAPPPATDATGAAGPAAGTMSAGKPPSTAAAIGPDATAGVQTQKTPVPYGGTSSGKPPSSAGAVQ